MRLTIASDIVSSSAGTIVTSASADPDVIAAALQHSAEDPKRGAHDAYRTAMSMLDFYINRAGRNLSAGERAALEKAKTELRKRFGKADN